ncbi:RING/U-box superfamily protein [Trifolium medium]|uniref:E3 ubiquitin-protein ligase RMA n=1 Tax=Trifolium medium TaxID=97028 RepID=A0A392NTN7_9FABA|nr:RING/U-box superfamily protein [Trifolium medium]
MDTDSNPGQLSVAFANGARLSVAIANGSMNFDDAIRQQFDLVRRYNHYGEHNHNEPSNVDVSALNKNKTSEKKDNVEKCCDNSDRGFSDCNICLDLAKEPVVTFCGHLFCWPCLYRWLYLRSSGTKDCPVCKGQVSDKNVIPIYGGGNNDEIRNEDSSSGTPKIPCRPNAKRVSWDPEARQIRSVRARRA